MPDGGAGRIDNPEVYRTLYVSDAKSGACAEAFAYLPEWDERITWGPPSLPTSVNALVAYTFDGEVCDLDDATRLVTLGIRPSEVVTKDRTVTQAWALRVHRDGTWAGVRWWSYYDPRWGSHGIWDTERLTVEDVEEVTLDHPAVLEAADVLNRRIPGRSSGGR